MASSPRLPPAADVPGVTIPVLLPKFQKDHIADHCQVTRNLALSRVLGAELILWWSFFVSTRALCCVANPVFHHGNFTLAARLSHFVCVVFRDSSRAADAALLVFDFDPSEFSSIDFSERECAHVLSGNISPVFLINLLLHFVRFLLPVVPSGQPKQPFRHFILILENSVQSIFRKEFWKAHVLSEKIQSGIMLLLQEKELQVRNPNCPADCMKGPKKESNRSPHPDINIEQDCCNSPGMVWIIFWSALHFMFHRNE